MCLCLAGRGIHWLGIPWANVVGVVVVVVPDVGGGWECLKEPMLVAHQVYTYCVHMPGLFNPSELLTGGVVVIVAGDAAVPVVRWDARRWVLAASKSDLAEVGSCPVV